MPRGRKKSSSKEKSYGHDVRKSSRKRKQPNILEKMKDGVTDLWD